MSKIIFRVLINQIPCKFLLTLIVVINILGYSQAQNQYDALIRKAAGNTYTKGSMSYQVEYSSLSASGDTLSDIFNVTVIKTKNEFSFNCRYRDSLFQVYHENILLYGWERSKRFSVSKVEKEDIVSDPDCMFQPFFDPTFVDWFSEDSVQTSMKYEDQEKYVFKSIIPDDDLDELFLMITISKKTKTIIAYSLHASIAGIPIWDDWRIISSKKINARDSLNVNKNLFYNALGKFKPYCNCPKIKNAIPQNENAIVDFKIKLPSLKLISTGQDTIQMNQLHARYYLVDFWYRSCHPCIKSLPVLLELHKKYDKEHLQIVSINNVDKNELVDKFRADNQIEYPVYVKSVELERVFGDVHIFPSFIIYDSNFNVLKVIEGFSADLLQKIEDVIK